MKKSYFLIAVLLATPFAFGNQTVLSEWVMPTRTHHPFVLRPHERTKPIVVGDVVYFGNLDGEVYAVHRKKGYLLWNHKVSGPIAGALAYGRSKIIVGDTTGSLTALNARDGKVAWKFKVKTEWLSAPVITRDRVIAMTSSEDVYALDSRTGKEIWHYNHRGDEKMTIRGTSSPAIFAGEVFLGFADGTVVALSADNGTELWTKRIRTRDRFYDVDMTPYVDATSVLVGSFDGRIYLLRRLTGEVNWVFPVGSYGGFLVEAGKVYFAGLNQNFYSLDLETGQVIWKTAYDDGGVGLTPIKVGEHIAFTTTADPVYVLSPKNGSLVWKGRLGAGTMAGAGSNGDEWFYCLSNYGNLFSYRITKTAVIGEIPSTLDSPSALFRGFSSR